MALPQPLHIFRKDLTHLWPETLFVLFLFVALAYTAPSAWADSEYLVWITLLALLLKFLMIVSWLVLIARAIQDESLVGDRQFWTSRPYHWASLLGAKVLLIFTCIYIPFFAMQCYMLHHVGLHPTLVIPALLHNLLLLTVGVIIPLAALSAVTSTFPRVLLTFIGAFLFILVLVGIFVWTHFLQMPTPHLDWIINTVFIALPAFVLIYQYKTRKTMTSRILLAATPIVCMIVIFLAPNGAIINKAYPVASGAVLTGMSDKFPTRGTPPGELQKFRDNISISLPVSVSGVDKEVAFVADGIRVTVTGGGVNYTSPFVSAALARNKNFSGERPIALLSFVLPDSIFQKIRNTPVDLHFQIAAQQYKADKPSTWHATLLPFSVPGNGVCSFPDENAPPSPLRQNSSATCRYPLQQPEFSFVSAPVAAASCSAPAAAPVTGQANVGGGSATLDFDPVVTVPLRFETGDPEPRHHYVLCPGTALTFVDAQTLHQASLIMDQKQVVLDPFAERFTPRSALPPGGAGQAPAEPQ